MSLHNLSELPPEVYEYYYECIAEEFLDEPPSGAYVQACWRGETHQTHLDILEATMRKCFDAGNDIREVIRKELAETKT